ncbi:uncharacterized protein NEMAJ01_0244 [Nematocida major]|uniref:uncharacterized protein n=1 Tax=Nematocida major TaxID=1912982 RepID=UPI0020081096|nr:uncharacterized protein NEMAJ01_0244 [Nematocida major]KAH9385348.1 hypothetical protein NEMAJ01_0244 [Nematocida major]
MKIAGQKQKCMFVLFGAMMRTSFCSDKEVCSCVSAEKPLRCPSPSAVEKHAQETPFSVGRSKRTARYTKNPLQKKIVSAEHQLAKPSFALKSARSRAPSPGALKGSREKHSVLKPGHARQSPVLEFLLGSAAKNRSPPEEKYHLLLEAEALLAGIESFEQSGWKLEGSGQALLDLFEKTENIVQALHGVFLWSREEVQSAIRFFECHFPDAGNHSAQSTTEQKGAICSESTACELIQAMEKAVGTACGPGPLPSILLKNDMSSLRAAIQSLFTISEVFSDFCRTSKDFIAQMHQRHLENQALKKKLQHLLEQCTGTKVEFAAFFGTLSALQEMASIMSAHGGRAAATESYKDAVSTACAKVEHALCKHWLWMHVYRKDSWFAHAQYAFLRQFVAIFYHICPPCAGKPPLEGKSRIFLSEYIKVFFMVDKEAGTAQFWHRKSLLCNSPRRAPFQEMHMHHVYYMDNEKQARKVVVLPTQAGVGLRCAHIIAYISALYSKPKQNLHVFAFSPKTRTWSYRDPEATAYAAPCSASAEILVFYYIKEADSPDAQTNLLLAEFRSFSDCREPKDTRILRFPLFLNELFAGVLAHFQVGYVCEKCAEARPARIRSLRDVAGATPHIYTAEPGNGKDYYAQNSMRIGEQADHQDLELEIANATLSLEKGKPAHKRSSLYIYTYHIRSIELGKHSTIYMKKNLHNNLSLSSSKMFGCNKIRTIAVNSKCENDWAVICLGDSRMQSPKISKILSGEGLLVPTYAIFSPDWQQVRNQLGIVGYMLEYMLEKPAAHSK